MIENNAEDVTRRLRDKLSEIEILWRVKATWWSSFRSLRNLSNARTAMIINCGRCFEINDFVTVELCLVWLRVCDGSESVLITILRHSRGDLSSSTFLNPRRTVDAQRDTFVANMRSVYAAIFSLWKYYLKNYFAAAKGRLKTKTLHLR